MNKVEYTVEDFVLDPEFRKWVLTSDEAAKVYWEEYLKRHPYKLADISTARKILLNLARETPEISQARIESTWQNIEQAVRKIHRNTKEPKVVPLNAAIPTNKDKIPHKVYPRYEQIYRVAGIFLFILVIVLLANLLQPRGNHFIAETPVVFEEHHAPPGVKSHLALQDGSRVILNSGSSLRYIKNFEADRRELELTGEAFFEVAKDSLRPFLVKAGSVTTKVLGTSFNIRAYNNEELSVSLLTGLVEIDVELYPHEKINLIPGEAVSINPGNRQFQKKRFDEEKLLAWTKKTIIFDHTPIAEVVRVLENWYGVNILFKNDPPEHLQLSGLFRDQSLVNVLDGLSYSARFEFNIKNDEVTLTFK